LVGVKKNRGRLGEAATSSFLRRELRLSLALCSERERRAALLRQRVEWEGSGEE
jgi:hypothetical protein